MNIEEARTIVRKCIEHTTFRMGVTEKTPPSLSEYSLRELLDANHAVAEANKGDSDSGRVQTVCADRLVAALYAVHHYEGDDESDVDPIAVHNGNALICLRLSADMMKED